MPAWVLWSLLGLLGYGAYDRLMGKWLPTEETKDRRKEMAVQALEQSRTRHARGTMAQREKSAQRETARHAAPRRSDPYINSMLRMLGTLDMHDLAPTGAGTDLGGLASGAGVGAGGAGIDPRSMEALAKAAAGMGKRSAMERLMDIG